MATYTVLRSQAGTSVQTVVVPQAKNSNLRSTFAGHRLRPDHAVRLRQTSLPLARSCARSSYGENALPSPLKLGDRRRGPTQGNGANNAALPQVMEGRGSWSAEKLGVGVGLSLAFILAPFLTPRTNLRGSFLSAPVALASTPEAGAATVTHVPAASSAASTDASTSAEPVVISEIKESTETAQVMSTPRVTATSTVKSATSAPSATVEVAPPKAEALAKVECKPVHESKPAPAAKTQKVSSAAPAAPAAVTAEAAPAAAAVVSGSTGDGDVGNGLKIAAIKGLQSVIKALEPSAPAASLGSTATPGSKTLNTDYASPKFLIPLTSLIVGFSLITFGVLSQIRTLVEQDDVPKAPEKPLPFPTSRFSNAPRPKSGQNSAVRGAGFGTRRMPSSGRMSIRTVPVGQSPPSPPPPEPVEIPVVESPQDKAEAVVVEADFESEDVSAAAESLSDQDGAAAKTTGAA